VKHAIIGSGEMGTALARVFARVQLEVAIANSRGPQTLASLQKQLGPNIVPQSVEGASRAEIIFLAVPFREFRELAKLDLWSGKIVVDVTNTFHAGPEELGQLRSSELVVKAFLGARVVKCFNHLPANELGTNPSREQQAVFVSSNDAQASATVAALASQLGFVPIELGKLYKGGVAIHVSDGRAGGLMFQNLYKPGYTGIS
jgi:predicted dinucleotide-binding enzyme